MDHKGNSLVPMTQRHGKRFDSRGEWIRGLYGTGLGFADLEYMSGAPYAEAGFMSFALRAKQMTNSILLRSRVI